MDKIHNPITNKWVNISGKTGKTVLTNYIKTLNMSGGGPRADAGVGGYGDGYGMANLTTAAFAAALKPPFLVGSAGSAAVCGGCTGRGISRAPSASCPASRVPCREIRLSKDAKKAKKAADATAMAKMDKKKKDLVAEMMNSKKLKKLHPGGAGTLEEAVAAYQVLSFIQPVGPAPSDKKRKDAARDFILMARRKATYNTTEVAEKKYKSWKDLGSTPKSRAAAAEDEVYKWAYHADDQKAALKGVAGAVVMALL